MFGIRNPVVLPRWQFGTRQLLTATALMALMIGTIRFLFVGDCGFYLWELCGAMMFATACGFAALGVFFGRAAAAAGFLVGSAVGAWGFWQMVTGGL